ncbi:HlyD family secretion protein [Manganibacter manganicus]|uniref:Hemolysin secretion protein D n=1 Tax=Manganibacter manganicus TaxID=1873176 RepID=A0A1V8RN21_9HYPH|nr:HlyD family secretion protein [Pseudaminobacter manganicus]OQM74587.1 hemolysin secretion protein D [Pseudaminobacter manganicus]
MPNLLKSASTYVALAAGVVGVLLILFAWRLPPFETTVEDTDNAYVRGNVTILSPQVTGYVSEVPVTDYAAVRKGDLIVRIDDRIYVQKRDQAKATLASKQAALAASTQQEASAQANIKLSEAGVSSAKAAAKLARANMERSEALVAKGFSTQSDVDVVRNSVSQAEAAVLEAKARLEVSKQALDQVLVARQALRADVDQAAAAVELAEIDLANTRIVAPEDGRLGTVGTSVGSYVAVGSQLTSLVPDRQWVMANFKETQVANLRAGQKATFAVDALGHVKLTGHITRFSPAAGSEFAVIKADNTSGNFTKVAQRLPVRIEIDAGQALAERLAPGMSVVVSVDWASQPDGQESVSR